MSDMNKYPNWCCTCVIRKPKDICEYCELCDDKPNGYQSEEDEHMANLEMLQESNALNMY